MLDNHLHEVLFDENRIPISSLQELRHYLGLALEREHAELWLNHNTPRFLALLINRRYQRAYVETNTEQSYDPDFNGEQIKADLRQMFEEAEVEWTQADDQEEAIVDFKLNNGQEDDIAVSRTAHLPDALLAVEHFFQHGTLGSSIRTQRSISTAEVLAAIDNQRI